MSEEELATVELDKRGGSRTAFIIALVVAGLAMALLAWSLTPVLIDGEPVAYGYFLQVTAVVYTALGVLIIYHQPRNTIGWLILFVGFMGAFSRIPIDPVTVMSQIESEAALVMLAIFGELSWILPAILPQTLVLQFFPDGRLPSPRWRIVTAMTVLGIISMSLLMAASSLAAFRQGTFDWTTPPPIEGNLKILESFTYGLMVASILGSLAAFLVRFRRSHDAERAQLKWLVYMVVTGVTAILLSSAILGDESAITAFVSAYFPVWLALGIGIAILRYQLFDIDIIIRRTLQYGLLTAVLIAIYFGVVLLVQSAFVAVTGEESPIAIVISTLVIAALFNPLRRRIQAFINHRFYRKQYDAALTLQQFAETAREEVDLDHLSGVLMGSINETMQPETAVLWLKSANVIFPETDR